MVSSNFEIDGVTLSENAPPYIIAEISANHNGSIDRAKATIASARNAGVNAVKIQTYTPDTMTIDVEGEDFKIKEGLWKGHSLYSLYGEAYTPFEWHEELFSYARKEGITLFSSPFDETAVDLLESLQAPAYKVASFELVDLPLIKYIAQKKKPMLMSTGMATLSEISEALDTARTAGCESIAIFHCVSSYPALIEDANVSAILKLKDEFGVQVGLSDHTIGNIASVAATALGATVIEKHFTLSREDGGVDSTFSLEPSEMASLVKDTKNAFIARGDPSLIRSSSEKSNQIFRRSLYFVADLEVGQEITKRHVRRIRPGYGLAAKHYDDVIGSTCLIPAKKGDRVRFEHYTDMQGECVK